MGIIRLPLAANQILSLDHPLGYDGAAITSSQPAKFEASQNPTVINCLGHNGDILLHISMRPRDNVVVFNTQRANGPWGSEERVKFINRFTPNEDYYNPTITIRDFGRAYEVLFNGSRVIMFNKRIGGDVTAIGYKVDQNQARLALSNPLWVEVSDF